MSQPATRTEQDSSPQPASQLSHVVTALMKGVVYRDSHAQLFADLLTLQSQARDYVSVIGLRVIIDETEGYAYLQSLPEDDEERDGTLRLVARRSLPFEVSLLLALLRKRLAQFDSEGGQTRLILSRDEVVEMLRVFLPASSNDVRLVTRIEAILARTVELGFVRNLSDGSYEVRRILKAFVDAQWLAELDARLAEYAAHAAGRGLAEGPTSRTATTNGSVE